MNLIKFNTKVCEKIGFKYDNSLRVLYGEKEGYTLALIPKDAYATSFNLIFSVSKDRLRILEDDLNNIKAMNTLINGVTISNFVIAINIKTQNNVDKYVDTINEIIESIINYFKDNKIVNTDEVNGEVCKTYVTNVKGNIQLIGDSTYNEFKNQINSEEVNTEKENVPMGLLGAFIGSILGVLCIIILSQIGFVASVSGVVMGFATLEGYRKIGKNLDKKGIILSIVVMIIMTYLACRLDISISVHREVNEMDIIYLFKNMTYFVRNGYIDSGVYYGNMALVYLFSALGAFSSVKSKLFIAKNSKIVKRLGE